MPMKDSKSTTRITRRAVLIGANSYWIACVEMIWMLMRILQLFLRLDKLCANLQKLNGEFGKVFREKL